MRYMSLTFSQYQILTVFSESDYGHIKKCGQRFKEKLLFQRHLYDVLAVTISYYSF